MDDTNVPEFLFIETEPTTSDIRNLLREMSSLEVSTQTGKLFGALAVLTPAERLSYNISGFSDILSARSVHNVLDDGLSVQERNALLELDVIGLSDNSRITARALLNVKERWIMNKTLAGLFKTARTQREGYISLVD